MILTKVNSAIMGPLSKLMGLIFNALYNLFFGMGINSLALSIIVFTVLIRLLMFPLNLQSMKSSKIQAYLEPEFSAIRKKYKGKKDNESVLAQQKETQELQKKYGIKMTTGCITGIIQFPIFIALYNVMMNIPAYVDKIRAYYEPIAQAILKANGSYSYMSTFAKENKLQRVASTLSKYTTATDATSTAGKTNINSIIDILGKCNESLFNKIGNFFNGNGSLDVAKSIHDNIGNIKSANEFIFGINLTETPGWRLTPLLIIPIASFVFQFLSMFVQPMNKTGDPQQDAQMRSMRTMIFIMPVFSFFITVNVPAGLGLYWAVSAFVSFVITFIINVYYNHANMKLIVEKAYNKAAKKIAKDASKGKVSLTERLTAAASGTPQKEEEIKKQTGIKSYGSMNLKNYKSDYSSDSDIKENSADKKSVNTVYKKNSISDRANAVKRFNNKED